MWLSEAAFNISSLGQAPDDALARAAVMWDWTVDKMYSQPDQKVASWAHTRCTRVKETCGLLHGNQWALGGVALAASAAHGLKRCRRPRPHAMVTLQLLRSLPRPPINTAAHLPVLPACRRRSRWRTRL